MSQLLGAVCSCILVVHSLWFTLRDANSPSQHIGGNGWVLVFTVTRSNFGVTHSTLSSLCLVQNDTCFMVHKSDISEFFITEREENNVI